MKRVLTLLLLLALVCPALGWVDNFQGGTATQIAYSQSVCIPGVYGCGTSGASLVTSNTSELQRIYAWSYKGGSGDTEEIRIFLNAGTNAGSLVGYPADYFAFTNVYSYGAYCNDMAYKGLWMDLYDEDSVNIGTLNFLNWISVLSDNSNQTPSTTGARFELRRDSSGGGITLYINGVSQGVVLTTAKRPWIYSFRTYDRVGTCGVILDTPAQWNVDDIIQETTSTGKIVGAIPHNWYILQDMLGSKVDGLYNQYNESVRTTYFDATYGSGTNLATTMNLVDTSGRVWQSVPITGYAGTARFNLTEFTASEAPTGLYRLEIAGTTAFDTLWYVGSGATIDWGKSKYAIGETATITYSISDAYFDTATYSYKVALMDQYGAFVGTNTTITTQSGYIQQELTDTTFDTGVYYAQLIATVKAINADIAMTYAATEVIDYIVMNGYVMNAETGATLSGANINITQGLTTATSTSLSDGTWNSSSNWLSGSAITVNTTLSGYTSDLLTILPLTAKSISLNISLIPDPATSVGTSVGGIVRDNVYSNPIPAATVTVRNGTESYTNITNIAGYYRVDNLYSGRLYDVWSSKTGYSNSTIAQKLAVGV